MRQQTRLLLDGQAYLLWEEAPGQWLVAHDPTPPDGYLVAVLQERGAFRTAREARNAAREYHYARRGRGLL